MTESDDLEPLEPQEAVSLYKQDRQDDIWPSTLRSHGYRLDRFLNWCEEYDVTNLNDLTGRDIQRFKLWRKQQVKQVTLKSTLDTLRVFLRFCQALDAVQDGLAESVVSPTIDREQNVSDAIIQTEVAETILEYQDKYNYASLKHALFRLLWESGMRIGAAQGIDIKDVHLRDAYVELHHRPETDTPLKNGKGGERNVALSPDLNFVLEDYINELRPERTDDYGRNPLFASSQGRYQKTSLRVYINQMTRPCCTGKSVHTIGIRTSAKRWDIA